MKCLLNQQWYRLSSPGSKNRLGPVSFRRFVGLALADPVPDHSTLSRFRTELSRRGLAERLLAEPNRQLDARDLMDNTGTQIDASLVEADFRRPHKGIRSSSAATGRSWNAMPEKPLFGAKMHLTVDQGSGLVRRADAGARPCLGQRGVPHREGDERAVYADRATTAGGIAGRWPAASCRRHDDGQLPAAPLDAVAMPQRTIGPIRAPIGRTFALHKRWYGYRRVRYRSLIKNALQLQLLAVALNLRRALVLTG